MDDRQKFRVYLNDVITGKKDPTIDKYEPRNPEKFQTMLTMCPFIRGYINFANKPTNGPTNGPRNSVNTAPNITAHQPTDAEIAAMERSPEYADRKDALGR